MATSNTAIKITSLPNIGNNIAPTTLIPVVNMSGVPTTQKANLQIAGNLILAGAGTANFVPAGLANLAYNVVNSNQANITRLGTLNINTFKVSGGTNGQYIQTDGTGNLSWVSGGGSGNGVVGGTTGQIQFNNAGNFGGSPNLFWDNGNARLGVANFAANSATIYGDLAAVNINASANIRPNAIYTDHYYYANGYVFGGGGGNGTPGGATTQVQFNDAGAFAGNAGFTFNKTSGLFSAPFLAGNGNGLANIQGANVGGFVANANIANTAYAVAGANVTGEVAHAASANSVAVANVVGLGNIATVALNGSSSQVLYGNGVWGAASSANIGNFAFDSTDVDGTTYDEIVLTGTNSGNIIVNADNLVMVSGAYQSDGLIAGGGNVYLFNGDPTYSNGIPQPGVGHIWQFDDTGNTTFPTGAAIANISGFGPGLSTFFGDANGATFGTGPGNDITFTPADGAAIYSNGFMWTFSTDGNLTTPGVSGNITGANVIEANTFLGTGNLKLQPDPNNNGAYLDVYLTGGPDVHIAGNGETVIVGSDAGANVSVQASGNVAIQANAVFGGTSHTWMFDYFGNLRLPGVLVAQASDNGSIVFSNNGTDTNGSLKVDGGFNMTVSANSNFYVKQAGQDRLAITNTNTDLMASANVVIHANKAGSEQNWIFDTTGLLTIPGDINIRGVNINFPGQYGNINWGTSYMAFSQYGRINTNVDFFANANVIGANILKSNTIVISSNANVSGNLILSSTTQIVSTPSSNGNITLDPDGTGVVNVIGNVVANNFSGNISITGNVQGTSPNVTLVAGSYSTVFDNTGNLTLPANGDILMTGVNSNIALGGTITANNFTSNTNSWTLAAGTNTVSFSVPLNGVYSLWVRGNIPNGIVTYTATVVVSNPNTPVVGSSYGWYYAAGNALVLTAIPTQIVGTVNSISNAVVSTATANVFTFGITNNSGTSQVVNYGYTRLG